MSIGTRVREARRLAKLTQQGLAAKVGMKQASISELETGESEGSTMVASLAAALGVSALWLQTGKGDRQLAAPEGAGGPVAAPAPTMNEMALQWNSPDEVQLLTQYRAATAGWKKAIQKYVLDAEKDPSVAIVRNKS